MKICALGAGFWGGRGLGAKWGEGGGGGIGCWVDENISCQIYLLVFFLTTGERCCSREFFGRLCLESEMGEI